MMGLMTGRLRLPTAEEGERMKSMKRALEIFEIAVMAVLFGPGVSLRSRRK